MFRKEVKGVSKNVTSSKKFLSLWEDHRVAQKNSDFFVQILLQIFLHLSTDPILESGHSCPSTCESHFLSIMLVAHFSKYKLYDIMYKNNE